MEILYSYSGQNVSLVVGAIDGDEAELQTILQPSAMALRHLDKLTAPSRRLEWLSARCLLKHLSPYDYEVVYDESGKPALETNMFTLSISHTAQMAGVIIDAHARKLGIDVEKISERVLRVRHKFMADNENFFPADESVLYCTLLWSAKEVLYKIMGTDYVDFKASFRILPFRFTPQGGMMQALVMQAKRVEPVCLHYKQIQDTVLVWAAAH